MLVFRALSQEPIPRLKCRGPIEATSTEPESHTHRLNSTAEMPGTVALGISPDLVAHGVIDLTGYCVSSPEDLANPAQVYRDPRFETSRIIYLNGTQIVAHEGVTSRIPGVVKMCEAAIPSRVRVRRTSVVDDLLSVAPRRRRWRGRRP